MIPPPSRSLLAARCRSLAKLGSALMGLALFSLTIGLQRIWEIDWITQQRDTFIGMAGLFAVMSLCSLGGAWQMRHTISNK